MVNTLYTRAADAASAVERAARRQPNNEKAHAQAYMPPSITPPPDPIDDDTSTLPGSVGELARQLRNAIGIMSESEMAAILQVSCETLATWRTKRRGPPHVKIGKRAFYLAGDFSQWVMGEVERQSQHQASAKNKKKRQHKPRRQTGDEREDHVTGVDGHGAIPVLSSATTL